MKKAFLVNIVLWLFLVTVLSGCGGGGKSSSGPEVPSGLFASGSLGKIVLSWTAVSDATGYNIYRSSDGNSFTKLAGPVTNNNYTDMLDNTDKTLYRYYVKTVSGNSESAPSTTARSMQGSRLNTTYTTGYTIGSGQWFVAEGTVEITAGELVVDSGGELYVLDNAIIKFKADTYSSNNFGKFIIKGLLRVLAVPQAPATFTTTVASPPNGEGFALQFDGAEAYNEVDGTGTIVQNTAIINLRGSARALEILNCAPRLYNLKVTSNQNNGTSYLYFHSGAIIENNRFEGVVPLINSDLRSSSFKMSKNIFRNGYYSIWFNNNSAVTSGQISANDFNGSKPVYLYNMTSGTKIPLEGNYWNGGTGTPPKPVVEKGGATTDISCNFDPALSSSPDDVGPTW